MCRMETTVITLKKALMGLFYWSAFKILMQDLTVLFQPVVESMGYELVGVEFNAGSGVLRVYIDHKHGVTVDDCARISHQISGILDVEDPIQQIYDLEVSSPGLDRPLFKLDDFQRFNGQMAKIKMSVGINGRRNFKGVLQGVTDARLIEIAIDGEIYQLPLGDIVKANLIGQATDRLVNKSG